MVSAAINTLIGVALTIVGGIIQSFGFIAQKVGHNKVNKLNENVDKDDHKSVLSIFIWWVGIGTYSIGGGLNAWALSFAAQSIIAPLGALDLATNTILSYFILRETITKRDIIAIIIIIIGSVVVVIFGPATDDTDVSIDELREYFEEIAYIVTISILTAISLIIFVISKYVENKNFKSNKNDEIIYGKHFLLFGWVWIATFFGSVNTLFIKSNVMIIKSSVSSLDSLKNNIDDYLTWIILVLWAICVLLMEYFRQKALSHFGALYVVPMFEVITIILTAIIGMVFFQEFTQFTALSASLFTLGILITLSGIFVLSYDIGKLLSNLYDNYIKVAFIEYDKYNHKYAKTIIVGGIFVEYFQQQNLEKPAICYNGKCMDNNIEMIDYNNMYNQPLSNNNKFHIKRYPEQYRILLRRWNICAAILHLIQSIILLILALNIDNFKNFKLPIDTRFLSYFQTSTDSFLSTSSENLGVIQFGPLIFIFFWISAFFHILVSLPYFNEIYWEQINNGKNYFRWIEYSLSSTLIIWIIAMLFGVTDISLLITISMTNITMNILYLMQEKYNNIRHENYNVDWTPFSVAYFIGITPWIVIYIYFGSTTNDTKTEIPSFVYGILITYFIFFNGFPINIIFQYKRIGPWKNYIFAELVYIVLSLSTKTVIGWLIFAALNQSNEYNIISS